MGLGNLIRNRTFYALSLSLIALILSAFGVEADIDVEVTTDRIMGVITAIAAALSLVGGWTLIQDWWRKITEFFDAL